MHRQPSQTTNMSFPPEDIRQTVHRIGELLNQRNETIAIAESACGGLISSYLVSVAGASSYYHGGLLTYSLKSRLKLSGWTEKEVQDYTGPCEDVAKRLARNLRFELNSTYALSETGWAGPGENAGTVYIGIASADGNESKEVQTGVKDRSLNMEKFARLALEWFLQYLESRP